MAFSIIAPLAVAWFVTVGLVVVFARRWVARRCIVEEHVEFTGDAHQAETRSPGRSAGRIARPVTQP
jgi:hypothetical protein